MEGDSSGTPSEMVEAAIAATNRLLPVKSQNLYQKAYEHFIDWCENKEVQRYSENILLAYMSEMSAKYKSSSLWSYYSKLKSTLLINKNVDIGKFSKLLAFLRKKSDGYVPKKSKILSREQILKFVEEAPDHNYLVTKIAVLLGIAGALRCQELLQLSLDDIVDNGTSLFITINDTKTVRTFCIDDNEDTSLNIFPLYKKYVSLRPSHTNHRRFFIYYKNGKCSTQVIGKNMLGKIPCTIASYLNLPKPELYTGHCIRRSSATVLANTDTNMTAIVRFGRRKSTNGDIETSSENRLKIAKPSVVNGQKDGTSISCHIPNHILQDTYNTLMDVLVPLVPSKSNAKISLETQASLDIIQRTESERKVEKNDKTLIGIHSPSMTKEEKMLVCKLNDYFEQEKRHGGPLIPIYKVEERVCAATGINLKTLSQIIASKRNGQLEDDKFATTPTSQKSKALENNLSASNITNENSHFKDVQSENSVEPTSSINPNVNKSRSVFEGELNAAETILCDTQTIKQELLDIQDEFLQGHGNRFGSLESLIETSDENPIPFEFASIGTIIKEEIQ